MAKKELKETSSLTIEQYDNGFTIKDDNCDIAEVVEIPQGEKRLNSPTWHERLGKIIAEDLAAMMDASLSNVAEITYTITVTEEEKE
jgi:hypothetical protein